MLSKTFLKLLDESIVPATIMIAAKVIGLAIANIVNHLSYTIQLGGSILPWTVLYNSSAEAATANTFSNFVMYLVVLIGFGRVLFQAHFLHASHISPKFHSRLAIHNLEDVVRDSFEIYHQALVWLGFLWIATAILFLYALSDGSLSLGLIGFLFSFIASYLYTKDIEMEVGLSRRQHEVA